MPFKNEENFIRQTLESILNQTDKAWECICVDDHSTDSSAEIVNEFALQYSQIHYSLNTGAGVISALQCGYKQSKGDLITRMDADDLMPVKKLEVLRDLIQEKSNAIATGKVEYFNALGEGFINYQNWLNSLVDNNNHWEHVFKECVIASPNWMINRVDFEAVGGFNSDVYPEDYDLVFRCFKNGIQVLSTSEVTHLWRDHETRASRVSELYKENTFIPLKVNYFKKTVYDPDRPLILWGAGRKGKAIATQLLENELPFHWLTNNENKIGKEIYGVKLVNDKSVLAHAQWILAVSQPEELARKQEVLTAQNLNLGTDYFVFV